MELDHTVVPSRDKQASAAFLAHLLGVGAGQPSGPFVPVRISARLTFDYADVDYADTGATTIQPPHHYAFRVSTAEFDAIFARIRAAGVEYYANPHEPKHHGRINEWGGRRSLYFDDPDGHVMEILDAAPRP